MSEFAPETPLLARSECDRCQDSALPPVFPVDIPARREWRCKRCLDETGAAPTPATPASTTEELVAALWNRGYEVSLRLRTFITQAPRPGYCDEHAPTPPYRATCRRCAAPLDRETGKHLDETRDCVEPDYDDEPDPII